VAATTPGTGGRLRGSLEECESAEDVYMRAWCWLLARCLVDREDVRRTKECLELHADDDSDDSDAGYGMVKWC